ncbi:MAG: HIT family protein [Campylobacteraceae bacterium]
MQEYFYKNDWVTIYKEEAKIPWIKVFTTTPYKELTDCPKELREKLYICMETIEQVLREYYNPEKINIAMFGNYVPHVHIHIMARFKEDEFFPESVWGKKQRESTLALPLFDPIIEKIKEALKPYM